MGIFDQQKDLEGFSDQMLVQEIEQPSGRYQRVLTMTEMERRKQMRERYEAEKAKAELAKPSIIEQRSRELQGIPSVDQSAISDQQQPQQQMASGGIVGYAHGGLPSRLPEDDALERMRRLLMQSMGDTIPESKYQSSFPYVLSRDGREGEAERMWETSDSMRLPDLPSGSSFDSILSSLRDRPQDELGGPELIPFQMEDGRTGWRPPSSLLPSPPGIREIPQTHPGSPDFGLSDLSEAGVSLGDDMYSYGGPEGDSLLAQMRKYAGMAEDSRPEIQGTPEAPASSGRGVDLLPHILPNVRLASSMARAGIGMGFNPYDSPRLLDPDVIRGRLASRNYDYPESESRDTGDMNRFLLGSSQGEPESPYDKEIDDLASTLRQYELADISSIDGLVAGARDDYAALGEFLEEAEANAGMRTAADSARIEAARQKRDAIKSTQRELANLYRTQVQKGPSSYEGELQDMRLSPEQESSERKAMALSGLGALIGGATRRQDIPEGMSSINKDLMSLNRLHRSDERDLMRELSELENIRDERNFQSNVAAIQAKGVSREASAGVANVIAIVEGDIFNRAREIRNIGLQSRLNETGDVIAARQAEAEGNARISVERAEIQSRMEQAVMALTASASTDIRRANISARASMINDLTLILKTKLESSEFRGDDDGSIASTQRMIDSLVDMAARELYRDAGIPWPEGGLGGGTGGPADVTAESLISGI